MNMKRAQIALAVSALLAAPLVMAGGWGNNNGNNDDDHKPALAKVTDPQNSYSNNVTENNTDNDKGALGGGAFSHAQGKIGVNVGDGTTNQQSNQASISDTAFVFGADAVVDATQRSHNNTQVHTYGVHNTSTIGDASSPGTFQGASGSIGVNSAHGDLNQQINDVAIDRSGGGDSAATIDTLQRSRDNTYDARDSGVGRHSTNDVTVKGNAFYNAGGNIGVNAASGIGNQQQNDMALTHSGSSGSNGALSADTTIHQDSYGNDYTSTSVTNTANMQGAAFSHAHGNIGVNASSGIGNVQQNELALANTANGTATTINTVKTINQDSHGNTYTETSVSNTAGIQGNAFAYASGNIGVNVSSGMGNLQSNGLSLTRTGVQ